MKTRVSGPRKDVVYADVWIDHDDVGVVKIVSPGHLFVVEKTLHTDRFVHVYLRLANDVFLVTIKTGWSIFTILRYEECPLWITILAESDNDESTIKVS